MTGDDPAVRRDPVEAEDAWIETSLSEADVPIAELEGEINPGTGKSRNPAGRPHRSRDRRSGSAVPPPDGLTGQS